MTAQSRHRLSESVNPKDHIRGPRSAAISLVEYGDFECPYCRAAEPIVAGLMEALGDQLSVTFRHFPMPAVHPHAQHAAEVAEAAAAQGKFWDDRASGLASGVRGTPTFYIDGARYDGSVALGQMLAAIRAQHPDVEVVDAASTTTRIPRVAWPRRRNA